VGRVRVDRVERVDPGEEGNLAESGGRRVETGDLEGLLTVERELRERLEKEREAVGLAEFDSRSKKETHWSVIVSLSPSVSRPWADDRFELDF